MLIIDDNLRIPMSELRFSYSRSSGPGGQNVNKVNTKATLRWLLDENESLPIRVLERFRRAYPNRINAEGELVIHSQRYRDQGRNMNDCLEKVRALVAAVAMPPRIRRKTKPTAGSKARRRKNKELQARKKQLRKPPGCD